MPSSLIALVLQISAAAGPPKLAPPPFAVGETLEYKAGTGVIGGGTAMLKVAAVEPYRGIPSWRFEFTTKVSANLLLYKYRNQSEFTSWTGVDDFVSRRFLKHIDDDGTIRPDDHLIWPDSGFFRDNNYPVTVPTPSDPIDDVAFFYFIRMTPLELGGHYTYQRYFQKGKNPVVIDVEKKRGTFEMPDGSKVPVLVLKPIVEDKPSGMFMRKRNAHIMLTDDSRRLPVQIDYQSDYGKITLKLQRMSGVSAPK